MYASQYPPYSYAPSSASPQPGYISLPEARRAIEDGKDKHTPKPSLPSIHEALGNDNITTYPAPISAVPLQFPHPAPPSNLTGGPSAEGTIGSPNPFSNGLPARSLMRDPSFSHQSPLQTEAPHSSLTTINTQGSLNAPLHPLGTGKSSTRSVKTGITSVGSQNPSVVESSAPTPVGSVGSPNRYSHLLPNYSIQSQLGGHSYHFAPYDGRFYMGAPRVEDFKGGSVSRPILPRSDPLERQMDVHQVETPLNEVGIPRFWLVT
jgi:hypothetical protein